MKNICLFFAFAFCSNLLFGQSQRLVFIEEFTQASCGPCASANPGFNALLNANTSKAVSLKYQVSWPGVDPMNAQNPWEVAKRVSYYGVGGVPDGYIDGASAGNPGSVTQTSIDNAYAVPSPFTIQLTHWFNAANDSIFINCEITCTQNVTMALPKVHVAMIEKTITFATAPGSNGEKVFENVMRKMYPNANGTSLATTWTSGQKKIISFKEEIPSYIYSLPEIAVVAWIEDDGDKNIKQSAFSELPGTPTVLPPIADFTSNVTTTCDGLLKFQDQSALFPTSWLWDFGDATTSNLENPNHKYNASGTYAVQLTATNAYGNDVMTKTAYVTVTLSGTAPAGVNDNICGSGVANLSATSAGSGALNWYNSAGALVNTGTTYSPTITGTTHYYVAEMIQNAIINTGSIDTALGGGMFFTANTVHGLYFDVLKPCTLVSVKTYADLAGNRTIQVLDAEGTIVHSSIINIPTGMNTITLNFALGAGTGYLIKIATGSMVNLYRNSGGATFPYTTGVINITGNTAGSNPTYYYFFYDWNVRQDPCAGPGTMVSGIDSCASGVNDVSVTNSLTVFPNPGSGLFTLSFQTEKNDNYTVKITNTLGQVVYEEALNNFSGAYSKEINISSYGKGVYILHISNSKNEDVKRVITY